MEQRISDGQKQISNILKDLKSDRALATVILFNGDKKNFFEKLLADLDKEFQVNVFITQLNYEFDPRITINTQAFEIFSRAVSQLIDIKFNLPE